MTPSPHSSHQPRYVVIHKARGKTPLEALQGWQSANPEFASLPASYAGRLDPMAEGKLLVLLGDECKKQSEYTGLDKEYEVEVLLGVGSDTGDVLGLVSSAADTSRALPQPSVSEIQRALKHEEGTHLLPYPVFSSKTVNGTPLFLHALQGTLDTISIPEHKETFYKIQLRSVRSISADELEKQIETFLSLAPRSDEPSKALGADFRINVVRESWKNVFDSAETGRTYLILKLRVTCGSGAYMRSLAGRIGAALGANALALSINRTSIGKYDTIGPFGFWLREYK